MQVDAQAQAALDDVACDVERALGIFHEPWLQEKVLELDWLATLANRVYIFGHWPVIAATLGWLIWKHREHFATYRSALLISHRLSSVRFAHRICVLAGGRITESGTHDELLAAGGDYAELFELQARSYR